MGVCKYIQSCGKSVQSHRSSGKNNLFNVKKKRRRIVIHSNHIPTLSRFFHWEITLPSQRKPVQSPENYVKQRFL